jgi:hypothetical protein
VVAAMIAIGAVVITNAYGPTGSPVLVLVTNGMWIVGSAGALVSVVALGCSWAKRDRTQVVHALSEKDV